MPSSGVQTCADRKSTRLNSSHTIISYAVFCLKKKTDERNEDDAVCGPPLAPTPPPRHSRECPSVARELSVVPTVGVCGVLSVVFFFLNDGAPPEFSPFPPPPPLPS